LRQAELDYERSAKLLASNSVSRAETDTMSVRLDVARARVAGAQSRVREASLALEDTVIRAPIGGVVIKRIVEVGSLVGAGSPAFVIADTSSVKVVFGAPDRLVDELAIGAELAVEIPATGARLAAKITRIAPSADRASRVFDVEATLPNPKDTLKAGMVAALSVPEAAASAPALSLPLTAILRSKTDPRGFAVFVIDGEGERGFARSADVKLGEIVGNRVLVHEGLERGQRVVSMGAALLAEGCEVRVIPSKER
jgi:multidrug efflux system membrane fusion protein